MFKKSEKKKIENTLNWYEQAEKLINDRLMPFYNSKEELERVKMNGAVRFKPSIKEEFCGLVFITQERFSVRKELKPTPYDKSMYIYVLPKNETTLPMLHYYSFESNTFKLVPFKENGATNLKNKFKLKLNEINQRSIYSDISEEDIKSIQECVTDMPHLKKHYTCDARKSFPNSWNAAGQHIPLGIKWSTVCDLEPNKQEDKVFFTALYHTNYGCFIKASGLESNNKEIDAAAEKFLMKN